MVYILLAEGFEECEALAPLDLLLRAKIPAKSVSVTDTKRVVGSHGIVVEADITYAEAGEKIDMIVLPGGGVGTKNLAASKVVSDMLKRAQNDEAFITAICAAPSVLGEQGYLKGRTAVCFPGFEDKLDGATLGRERVVRDGKIITANGMGASTEFGLALVAALSGDDTASALRRAILY